jgi:hypothetical protein
MPHCGHKKRDDIHWEPWLEVWLHKGSTRYVESNMQKAQIAILIRLCTI